MPLEIHCIQANLLYTRTTQVFPRSLASGCRQFFCSKIQEHRIIDALPQYLCTHSFIVWWFPKSIAIEDTAILFLVLCQQMNKNIQTNPFQCSLKIKGNNKTFEEINVSSRRKHGPSFPSTFSRTTSCRRKSQSLSFQMNSDRKK